VLDGNRVLIPTGLGTGDWGPLYYPQVFVVFTILALVSNELSGILQAFLFGPVVAMDSCDAGIHAGVYLDAG